MVGGGALLECVADPRVRSVVAITRSPTGYAHPKVRELRRSDFFDYHDVAADFSACDACFFCLGVSSVGMSEAEYTRLTYDLTLTAARAMVAANPRMTFCYVSGVGTDSTERGRVMWARVKGKTENALLALPFAAAYMFRPGYIQPVGGVKSRTGWVQAAYTVLAPAYPLMRPLLRGTTTANFGRALIEVAARGYSKRILYSDDINALARPAVHG
jgi:uncharacterized protein YbjT (DUF2867 family)